MESVTLFTETRNEYLKQLSSWIVPPLVEFFRKEYNALSVKEGKRTMIAFQNFCAEIPRWNQDVIESNIGIILDNCRCDYVEELMTAVFIAHTKMLTAIRVNTKKKNLQITLPKLDHFLHRVFVECARGFWKAPFLFADELMPIEKQKNVLQAEAMCTDALSGAVRSLLPVKNILRDYLDEGGESESDEEEETVKKVKKGGAVKEEEEAAPSELPAEVETEEIIAPVAEAVTVPAPAPAPIHAPAHAPAPAPIHAPAPAPAPASAPAFAPVPELPTANSPQPDTEPPKTPESVALPVSTTPVTIIEKVDTPPQPALPTISNHSASAEIPASSVVLEKAPAAPDAILPQNLMIDTEPAVHFTPYDMVYDENTAVISEIRYAPKVSVEDKPPSTWGMDVGGDDDDEEIPKLTIGGVSESLAGDEFVEDLEAPPRPKTPEDIDVALGGTGDFEELS